jgi:hypothetical protein
MTLYPRRQSSSHPPLWESERQHSFLVILQGEVMYFLLLLGSVHHESYSMRLYKVYNSVKLISVIFELAFKWTACTYETFTTNLSNSEYIRCADTRKWWLKITTIPFLPYRAKCAHFLNSLEYFITVHFSHNMELDGLRKTVIVLIFSSLMRILQFLYDCLWLCSSGVWWTP